jgi:hypothetical protein
MNRLFVKSYLLLLMCECLRASRKTALLRQIVQATRVKTSQSASQSSAEQICHAMDLACVFYPKSVSCLHRSVATTLLLRRHGIPAELVIGAQLIPFKSHAWVELNGSVINDKPYVHEIYNELERC